MTTPFCAQVKVSVGGISDGIPCIFTSMLAWQDQLWIGKLFSNHVYVYS